MQDSDPVELERQYVQAMLNWTQQQTSPKGDTTQNKTINFNIDSLEVDGYHGDNDDLNH